MNVIVEGMLSEKFGRGADYASYQRILWHLREQQERNKKAQNPEVEKGDVDDAANIVTTLITSEQADLLQAEIDIWQEATVETVMNYDLLIERTESELALMLSQAHVLDDGRRVFKTEDGLQVFDEHGNELNHNIIHPDEISNSNPRWEQYQNAVDRLEELNQGRSDALVFQDKLDNIQDRLDNGEITQAEFEDLRQDLIDSAPQTIMGNAAKRGLDVGSRIPDLSSETPHMEPSISEIDINLDNDLAALPVPQL